MIKRFLLTFIILVLEMLNITLPQLSFAASAGGGSTDTTATDTTTSTSDPTSTSMSGNASSSNCVFTIIGALSDGFSPTTPPDCNTTSTVTSGGLDGVVSWALKIATALEPGLPYNAYYCRMEAAISNGSYSASLRHCDNDGVNPTGRYWCTDIVIDAYNLAGITSVPKDEAVFNMINDWKTAGGGMQYYDFTNPSTHSTVLPQIQPGFAIMFDPDVSVFNGREHVAIIHTITLDSHGNGVIHTYEADSPTPLDGVYPVANYEIQSYDPSIPVAGFGGATVSTTNPPTNGKAVIVLDPGHSGTDIPLTDPATGLLDHDYPNYPEIQEVFTVAQQVKQKLEADGYTVIMTKNNVNDTVSLRSRADIANKANAALAVSIHDDHTASWANFAQIYVQQVSLYRTNPSGTNIMFNNSAVAQQSQTDGQIFAQQRTAAEGHTVSVTPISFDGRSGIAPGNIPEVELFATVPWVYNEVGGIGVGQTELNKYAQGIINGIEKSVPLK